MEILVATLVLNVTVDDGSRLRLAAHGVQDETVYWRIDDRPVGATRDGMALEVLVDGGEHRVTAQTPWLGSWSILGRSAPTAGGWTFVYSAHADQTEPEPRPIPGPWAGAALLAASIVARRFRPKTP